MIKFDILNRWTGKVQFTAEIDCDENASRLLKVGLAVKCAVKAHANLADAHLARAHLAHADLVRANLTGANLAGANLAYANLAYADLVRANLTGANLAGANLAYANLAGAKWRDGIVLTRAPIQIFNLKDGWPVTILEQHMQIGCELHSHDEWAAFDDRRICEMDGKRALKFWKENRDWLLAACRAHAVTTVSEEAA